LFFVIINITAEIIKPIKLKYKRLEISIIEVFVLILLNADIV